jgi:ribose transport system permease protein
MKDLVRRFGTLIALVAIVAGFMIASPHSFGAPANLINIPQQMSLLAIVAVGATVVMAAGEFDLSTAPVVSFGGILVVYLFKLGVPPPLAVALVLAVAAAFGAVSGLIVAQFNVPSFIATLAAGTIIGGTTFWLSDGATLLGDIPNGFRSLARGETLGLPTLTWWLVGIAVVAWILLDKTEAGRRIYAIGGNREAARLSGVAIVPNTMLAFVICAVLAALVGMLLCGRINSANPTGGGGYLLSAYAAVFLGMTAFREGEANVPGTIVGAAIIAVIGNGLTILGVSTFLQDIVTGTIIIAAVLVRRVGQPSA